MRFIQTLIRARFLRREKRFFIYAQTEDGRELVAHTNNTGTMRGCLFPGATVWLSPAQNPARKLKWTLEIVTTPSGTPVGVNTALANELVAEAVTAGVCPCLAGFASLQREVKYGSRGSRVDLVLTWADQRVWVEVKNASLVEAGHGRFPDAPTARGRKHLRELMDMVQAGDRAALVFCSQRPDARTAGPADDIDSQYGLLLREAVANGVELYGFGCRVDAQEIRVDRLLEVDLRRYPHR